MTRNRLSTKCLQSTTPEVVGRQNDRKLARFLNGTVYPNLRLQGRACHGRQDRRQSNSLKTPDFHPSVYLSTFLSNKREIEKNIKEYARAIDSRRGEARP